MIVATGYVVGLLIGMFILGLLRKQRDEIYPDGEIRCIFWPFYLLGKVLAFAFWGVELLGEYAANKIKNITNHS